jgi:single-stranded-DNA-specific exonuclease
VLAAGLTVESDKIDLFREKINEFALNGDPAVPVLSIDCKINPSSINIDLLNSINILEPFGAENPQPLFGLYNMELTGIQPVGAGKHLRLSLRRKSTSIVVIMFSVTQEEFPYTLGDVVDVAVKFGVNEYQGKTQVSIQAKAIKLSKISDTEVCSSLRAYEDFCLNAPLLAESKEMLFIDRDFCGNVYRFIKANNGWNYSTEILCYRLGLPSQKTGACQIALDVFCELGILVYNEGKYIVPEESHKSALDNSEIFKRATE